MEAARGRLRELLRVASEEVRVFPLLDTTLLTNAPGEPNLWSQLRSEIESADRIDVVMAFIRRSGIGPLLDALRRHCVAFDGEAERLQQLRGAQRMRAAIAGRIVGGHFHQFREETGLRIALAGPALPRRRSRLPAEPLSGGGRDAGRPSTPALRAYAQGERLKYQRPAPRHHRSS